MNRKLYQMELYEKGYHTDILVLLGLEDMEETSTGRHLRLKTYLRRQRA